MPHYMRLVSGQIVLPSTLPATWEHNSAETPKIMGIHRLWACPLRLRHVLARALAMAGFISPKGAH
eukprot:5209273-Amphidinium_carterae.1